MNSMSLSNRSDIQQQIWSLRHENATIHARNQALAQQLIRLRAYATGITLAALVCGGTVLGALSFHMGGCR